MEERKLSLYDNITKLTQLIQNSMNDIPLNEVFATAMVRA